MKLHRVMNNHRTDELDMLALREANYHCTSWLAEPQEDFMPRDWVDTVTRPVNAMCREKLVLWCYEMVDLCHFNEQVAEIAVSMIDRFMSTRTGKHAIVNRHKFRVAFMTSLYTACKMMETNSISSQEFANQSLGEITWQELVHMEKELLFALNWRLYRPTTLSVLQATFQKIPKYLWLPQERQTIWRFVRDYCRLAMTSPDLIGVPASALVHAAVTDAFQRFSFSEKAFFHVSSLCSTTFHLSSTSEDFIKIERVMSASSELTQYVLEQKDFQRSTLFMKSDDDSIQFWRGGTSPKSVSHSNKS